MGKDAAFTVEKIPVRFSLQSLSSKECLLYSTRHYFSAIGKHASQHPLMHQIDKNPDCVSLAICAERIPISHCFFHYKKNSEKKTVVFHSLMVMPHLRGRGIGSLMFLLALKSFLSQDLKELKIEVDFPTEGMPVRFASKLFREVISRKGINLAGQDIWRLINEIESEDKIITGKTLKNLIANPEYSEKLYRKECVIGVVSDNDHFFDAVWKEKWPAYILLKPVHLNFLKKIEKDVESFNLLIIESATIKSKPLILKKLTEANPELPVVIVGESSNVNSPSVLFTEKTSEFMGKLYGHLTPYHPENSINHSAHLKSNLLHLPESGRIVNYKNLHKGMRLFIIASGPSLSDVDPSLFAGETTMTLNDALIKFPNTRYASIMDSRKLHEMNQELRNVKILFTLQGNSFGVEINLLGPEGFSLDLGKGIYSGYTVAYFSLQVAIYMGFKEIYFVGLDLGNTSKKSHFFGTRPLQDRNRPEVYAQMRRSFEKASVKVKQLGINVYNCSPVSELKCFPFRLLREALN